MPLTSRLALPSPANSDAVAVPADILALAQALDPVAVTFDAGTLASRPAAGQAGRLWYATNTGVLSWDTGTAWVDVNPSGVVDGAAGVGTLRTLGAGALQATAGNDARLSDQRTPTDGSVTAAKVANALKPSAGAAGSTETLRALGTAAGTAAAGSHKSQHQDGGADEFSDLSIGFRKIKEGPFWMGGGAGNLAVGDAILPLAPNGTLTPRGGASGFWSAGNPSQINVSISGLYVVNAGLDITHTAGLAWAVLGILINDVDIAGDSKTTGFQGGLVRLNTQWTQWLGGGSKVQISLAVERATEAADWTLQVVRVGS